MGTLEVLIAITVVLGWILNITALAGYFTEESDDPPMVKVGAFFALPMLIIPFSVWLLLIVDKWGQK